jgi:hypothetical protein
MKRQVTAIISLEFSSLTANTKNEDVLRVAVREKDSRICLSELAVDNNFWKTKN